MTGVPESSSSVSQVSAVDEEGTKFYLIENETTSRYHLQQTTSGTTYSQSQQSMSHDNVSTTASRSKSSHSDPSQSSLNPMEFNFWMFQQHQAAIAAFASSQTRGSANGEVRNNATKDSSRGRKAPDTASEASSQVPIPEHLFSLAPPGFEPVSLVLTPPDSVPSKDAISSSNSRLNASDSSRLENSTNKQRGAESSKLSKVSTTTPDKEDPRKRSDASNGRKHQRSRSRTKKGRKNSGGSCSEDDDRLTRNSSKSKKKDRADEHDDESESRKRKRSPESSHIKKDRKAKRAKKSKQKSSKKSKKKKSKQLKWAVKLQKPICLHSRQSDEELFEILKEEVSPDHKLHRHCYTETPENAIKMLQHFKNMYFGFTNVLAYSNAADARHTAAIVPLERILLETDAPYFLPPKAPKAMKNSNPGMAIQVTPFFNFRTKNPRLSLAYFFQMTCKSKA